jgi:predicted exporter
LPVLCCPRQLYSRELWIIGVNLNITVLMGMTMIIGTGIEMAIFYVPE